MKAEKGVITHKNLLWFYVASVSLLLSGSIISYNHSLLKLFVLVWCNISGVFLIYRFNDFTDHESAFRFNIVRFLSTPSHLIVTLQLLFFAIPAAFLSLEKEILWILSIASILGFIYSFNFKLKNYSFKLKNIFLVKNLLIGLVWGSLVLIGSENLYYENVFFLFVYCSLQVFIGGVIRDVPDLKMDEKNGVNSLPVVLGVANTIKLMHFINFISLILYLFIDNNLIFFLFFLIPFFWRCFNLLLLKGSPNNLKWSQTMNLFTCVLIFIVTIFNVFILK